ncbi:MAG: hypothetical protein J3R72DRAFT_497175 [Linnemannia gamsii]|nr:MAG: hypothetical protein J3R72DRAFT_497175 [Linnemannia gamsii]
MDPNDLLERLKTTRSFEWCDDPLAPVGRRRRRGIPNITTVAQFPSLRALEALALMRYLVRVTLIFQVGDHLRNGLLTILDPESMPNLRVLVLHLTPTKQLFPIARLYPLFSILEELDLRGTWYNTTDNQANLPPPPLPPKPSASAQKVSWRLKKLAVQWTVPSILKWCDALEHLSLRCWVKTRSTAWRAVQEKLLEIISELRELKVITINRSMDEGEGVVEEYRIREGETMGLDSRWMRWSKVLGAEDKTYRFIRRATQYGPNSDGGEATGPGLWLDLTLAGVLDIPAP